MWLIKRILVLCLAGYIPVIGYCQDFEIIYKEVTTVTHGLRHAVVLNDSTIIALGGHGWGSGSIIKSTDYGQSWVKTDVLHNLFQSTFVNDSVGYAVGEGATVMKTVDGGESWVYQNTSIISPAFQNRAVAFADENVGFVGPANGPGFAFLYTYDGGETWQNAEAGAVYGRGKIQVVDDSTVYSAGFGPQIYRSDNLGQSWGAILMPEDSGGAWDLHFFDRDTGLVLMRQFDMNCGNNHYLAKTVDAGITWTSQYFPCSYFSNLSFPSRNVGYATGAISASGTRFMWRTFDGGESWHEFEYPVGENASSGCIAMAIACVDADTCYMPTNCGNIVKMTNATEGALSAPRQPRESAQLKVYPNPNNGQFMIDLDLLNTDTGQLNIYSIDGRLVFQKQLGHSSQNHIDTSGLPSGTYILSLQHEENRYFAKFIKL
ncbi:MAG: T9SS C-terminal target domain-containing protein [Cryomorphaceae bacterium]|nr:MAG: T9SS C-terminal target domain-containing protein [Cryomorphaceae bacterium]